MFELILNGKFELENPDEFTKEFQMLLQKFNTEFRGQNAIYKLPDYVDYQRIETEESRDSDIQQ